MKMTMVGAAVLAAGLTLSGCVASTSGSSYGRYQAREAQEVRLGYVDSVRKVQIEGSRSGVGAISGAALGGVAGNSVGRGRGRTAATIGGAVVGGLVGAAIEENATRNEGLEITVRLDNGRLIAVTQTADEPFYPGDRVRVMHGYDGTTRVAHDYY
ncbi:MAG: hypothetical protein CSA09_03240 [Candidatus Contendobacter odensis]|uniref:Glycine zipper 2TM domain-containing protein n=1 Tax=Candidatus Contendibacter odensensis TaxID=1400860 RepID=A0A2G6PF38_9GAMM|nr:MAG: hypothetical protein CSA09_03240 [Candidatus Contendobacter odensis]